LLNTNNTTSNLRRRQLSEVDQDLRTGDTDSDTADDTTDDKMGDVLRGALQNSTGDPEETGNHEGLATTQMIRDTSCDKGSDKRSCRHGSCDAALFC
jgi:hypothetical protein